MKELVRNEVLHLLSDNSSKSMSQLFHDVRQNPQLIDACDILIAASVSNLLTNDKIVTKSKNRTAVYLLKRPRMSFTTAVLARIQSTRQSIGFRFN